jgi:hypothetical protein
LRLRRGNLLLASSAIGIQCGGVGLRRLQSRSECARHNEQAVTLGWECRLNGEWAHARQSLNR